MTKAKTEPVEPDDPAAPIAAALAEVDDFTPSGAELVISDPHDRVDVMATLDRHDEQLILQELQRRVIAVMLYKFPGEDGKEVVDLSYQGVNECIRVMNATGKVSIAIDPGSLTMESVFEDLGAGPEPCWVATVYALEKNTGYGQFGTFVQAKRMALKAATATRKKNKAKADGKPIHIDDDNRMANPFARQNALNKAQRNALRIMVPEGIRQTLIAQYINRPEAIRVIQAGAGAQAVAELPPPLTDERATAQLAEAKRLYDLLHAAHPLVILPAQFFIYQARNAHSHDGLDAFIEFLRGKCQEYQVEVPDAA